MKEEFHGTTIISVRRRGEVALGGDGQVTLGNQVMKGTAVKVRTVSSGKVLAGFAGSTSDAMTLFDMFEGKLEEYHGNITRAVVEFSKDWRKDKYLRKLEALLIVVDKDHSFILSGSGDVIEPEEGIAAIGSGGGFASSAAKMLLRHTEMSAREIVERSMGAASEACIYTNDHITILEL